MPLSGGTTRTTTSLPLSILRPLDSITTSSECFLEGTPNSTRALSSGTSPPDFTGQPSPETLEWHGSSSRAIPLTAPGCHGFKVNSRTPGLTASILTGPCHPATPIPRRHRPLSLRPGASRPSHSSRMPAPNGVLTRTPCLLFWPPTTPASPPRSVPSKQQRRAHCPLPWRISTSRPRRSSVSGSSPSSRPAPSASTIPTRSLPEGPLSFSSCDTAQPQPPGNASSWENVGTPPWNTTGARPTPGS
ncbi:hypothetical protein B0T18DRAFT_164949 [Schizothecium vesticola]|uniref:Uncharacterized protein n=1 Tax=Schizothecium vesticola TaxID=314040 RepID=A0AA40EXE1_9PEZI|nr:hypothetical protein B0T18DRAFT_164949 [Schizothecium vesticola]